MALKNGSWKFQKKIKIIQDIDDDEHYYCGNKSKFIIFMLTKKDKCMDLSAVKSPHFENLKLSDIFFVAYNTLNC